MVKNRKSVSASLNEEQERMLIALLNLIIPPSEDRKMPGAADVGFFAYMHNENFFPWVREGLLSILEESHNRYGQEFSALRDSEKTQLINRLRRRHFRFFSRLTTEVIQCYYQHEQVLQAIGLEARAPFPEGYLLEEGDLTLLEPVYERGKIYRE